MAAAESYKKGSVNNVIHEHDRTAKNLKNDVVKQRSHLNYGYGLGDKNANSSAHDFVMKMNERVSEIMQGQKLQDQTHVLGEWVITYPVSECDTAEEDLGQVDKKGRHIMHRYHVAKDPEQMKAFFDECWNFVRERYGADNVLGAWVHMDETTPQMHIDFVPETESRKTHRRTVSSASLLSLYEKINFQKDLEKDMEMKFHKKGLILNGKGKGNKSPQELREEQARKDSAERDAKEKAEQERLQAQSAELGRLKQWLNGYELNGMPMDEAWDGYDAVKHPEAHQKADRQLGGGVVQDSQKTPQKGSERAQKASQTPPGYNERHSNFMDYLHSSEFTGSTKQDDGPEF